MAFNKVITRVESTDKQAPSFILDKRRIIMISFIISLIIGAIAGWLAGQFVKGSGFGLLWNLIIGIIGSVIGGFLFGILGLAATSLIGSIITSTIGAVILLYLVNYFKKGRR